MSQSISNRDIIAKKISSSLHVVRTKTRIQRHAGETHPEGKADSNTVAGQPESRFHLCKVHTWPAVDIDIGVSLRSNAEESHPASSAGEKSSRIPKP
jgi:hypothetical protein